MLDTWFGAVGGRDYVRSSDPQPKPSIIRTIEFRLYHSLVLGTLPTDPSLPYTCYVCVLFPVDYYNHLLRTEDLCLFLFLI